MSQSIQYFGTITLIIMMIDVCMYAI